MANVIGGESMNLITGYAEGEDTDIEYGQHRFLAQTFTLDNPYTVLRFRFKSWTQVGGRFYHYALRKTDATGKPLAEDFYHTTVTPTNEYWFSPGKWRRFDFMEFPELPAGTYAIVASVPDAPGWQWYQLRADASASAYPGGKAWLSNDDGVTWEEIPDTDLMFEVWGWQPPPVAPPPPVISNWAPLKLEYTRIDDGYELVVTTDIPVHLYMRWSATEPLKHRTSELRRGLIKLTGTRYCFVTWKENEQTEPGDTYTHTFIKTNWPVCQTRWFYFIGTKQTEEQPSSSPIFYKHRVPELEFIIKGEPTDGWYRSSWGSWPQTWQGCPWSAMDESAIYVSMRCTLTASYWIRRGFLGWDLSGLSPSMTAYAVSLRLWVASTTPQGGLGIVEGKHVPPYFCNDYQAYAIVQTPYVVSALSALVVDAYNDFVLNAAGIAYVNSKIGSGTPPTEEEEIYDTANLTTSPYIVIYNRVQFLFSGTLKKVKVKTKTAGNYTLRVKSDDGVTTYQTHTIYGAPADSWITFDITDMDIVIVDKYRMEVTRPSGKAYAASGLFFGTYWNNLEAAFNGAPYIYTNAMGFEMLVLHKAMLYLGMRESHDYNNDPRHLTYGVERSVSVGSGRWADHEPLLVLK
ncbi:hypothetical protein ES703_79358 [subsurface metagenome]